MTKTNVSRHVHHLTEEKKCTSYLVVFLVVISITATIVSAADDIQHSRLKKDLKSQTHIMEK